MHDPAALAVDDDGDATNPRALDPEQVDAHRAPTQAAGLPAGREGGHKRDARDSTRARGIAQSDSRLERQVARGTPDGNRVAAAAAGTPTGLVRDTLIGACMRAFASDNYAPALPEVLEAMVAANTGHVVSYGDDPVTARLAERVREHFGAEAVGFPVFNGTAANVVGLRAMLRPWQGVICAETAHLNVDEG